MKRRQLNFILMGTGVIVAILLANIVNLSESEKTQQIGETQHSVPDKAPSKPIAVASVSLPSPPSLNTLGPIIAPLPPAASPVQENAPMKVAPKPSQQIQKNQPVIHKIEPLKGYSRSGELIQDVLPVNPMTPKTQHETAKEIQVNTVRKPENTIKMLDETVHQTGRPLLRLLEHGEGPTVEITWPPDRRSRNYLHHVFTKCYGMRVAVLDSRGHLFNINSSRGSAWAINMDQFSGFIRQSNSGVTLEERQTVMRIRNRHGLDLRAAAVRIFPRRADALLLGGLSQLVGANYRKVRRIQAAYLLDDNQVQINSIRVDGMPIAGTIDLSHAAHRGCIL